MNHIATGRWADPDYISAKHSYKEGDIWIGRHPHNSDEAIGYSDDRHVVVCAGAGSGKGRSFIINNLALYSGSTITYDPKGELPDILAPRRGDGDEYCEGMGQEVFVLDPLNRSNVDDKYRAFCDPIAMLDPEDDDFSTWCKRLARSLVKKKESRQGQDWAEKGMAYVAMVIEYVVTAPIEHLPTERRDLHMVYQLVTEGCVEAADLMTRAFKAHADEHNAKLEDGEVPIKPKVFDPYEVLIDRIINNENGNRFTPMKARKFKRDAQEVQKYFVYVTGEGAESLDWLARPAMERVLSGEGMDESRRFDPRRLKTDPKGISVFIVMPVDDLDEYEPWLQCLFIGIFAAIRAQKIKPKVPILTVLDEFSSLGYQEYIATSLDNIRGAGMKLVFILQNFGKLKKLYGDEMDSFFTNSGLELYFGRIGRVASDYLAAELGEAEVVMHARSINQSETEGESHAKGISFGHTDTTSSTITESEGTSDAHTRSRQWNWSKNIAHSNSENWGSSRGNSMGSNYGPHVFFEGLEHSSNYGTTLNRNYGGGRTDSHSRSRGGGGGVSNTHTVNRNTSTAEGTSHAETVTEQETITKNMSRQIGGGLAESFHKKPLLEPHEINSYLATLSEDDRDHPAYPGLMLVRIAGEEPLFVRRSNYDQDPSLVGCFSKDPLHKFVPLHNQPLLGHQYTPNHIGAVRLPEILLEDGYSAETVLRAHQIFSEGDCLAWVGKIGSNSPKVAFRALSNGRILDVYSHAEFAKDGAIFKKRTDRAFTDEERRRREREQFTDIIQCIENTKKQKAEEERNRKQIQERLFEEGKNAWKELQKDSETAQPWMLFIAPIGGLFVASWAIGIPIFFLDLFIDFLFGNMTPFLDGTTSLDRIFSTIFIGAVCIAPIVSFFIGFWIRKEYLKKEAEITERYGPASKYGL